jgi:hypothetical protein
MMITEEKGAVSDLKDGYQFTELKDRFPNFATKENQERFFRW